MSAPVRRAAPSEPKTLERLITDFDERLPPGDGDVEVPAATWRELVGAAAVRHALGIVEEVPVGALRERIEQLKSANAELWDQLVQTRFASVSKVASRVGVDVETVRRWCRARHVVCQLTPGGRGQWRIEVDSNGFDVSGGKDDDGVKWIELKSSSVTFRMDDGTALALAYILRDTVGSLGTACNALSAINEPSAVPPPRKRKARAKKAYCGACNAETPHDGNDECTVCAAREVQKLAQQKTPLEQAIEEKAGGAS